MKKFLSKVLAATAMLCAMLALTVVFVPVPADKYLQAYVKKVHLLDTVPSPRVVFVGGSNLAFGLDSKRVVDSLHLPVINYGLHAGIGMKYMLDDVCLYARKGDVLVFAPEYVHFFGDGCHGEGPTLLPLMWITRGAKLHLLDMPQWKNLLSGIAGIGVSLIPPRKGYELAYRASGVNEWGDEVNHWQLPNTPISSPQLLRPLLNRAFLHYFLSRLEELEQRGCRVVLAPPVCREAYYRANRPAIEQLDRAFRESGRPYSVEPERHVVPDEHAYDTDYHVDYEGVQQFTSRLIEELRLYLRS